MENKYYTPSIEDIRVGYECEWKDCDEHTWEKKNEYPWEKRIIEADEVEFTIDDVEEGRIRTPYLTKEQIEAEGWVEMSPPIISISREFRNIPFIKDGYRLDYNINSNQLAITISREFLFYGECKSINELRIICKLLNIK